MAEAIVASFRSARAGPLSEDAVRSVKAITSAYACFSGGRSAARRGWGGGRGARRTQPPTCPKRQGPPESCRAVMSDLNKLTTDNYDKILRRIRLQASAADLEAVFRAALSRSFSEFENNSSYISLMVDVVNMSPSMVDVIRGELPSKDCIWSVVGKSVDPGDDYDGYCRSVALRRRAVGRAVSIADLLSHAAIGRAAGAGVIDVYTTHTDVISDALQSGAPSGATEDAVELALDVISRLAARHAGVAALAKSSLASIDKSLLPPRCRFKVMDVLEM